MACCTLENGKLYAVPPHQESISSREILDHICCGIVFFCHEFATIKLKIRMRPLISCKPPTVSTMNIPCKTDQILISQMLFQFQNYLSYFFVSQQFLYYASMFFLFSFFFLCDLLCINVKHNIILQIRPQNQKEGGQELNRTEHNILFLGLEST